MTNQPRKDGNALKAGSKEHIFSVRRGHSSAIAALLVAVMTACAQPVDRIISEQVRSSDQRASARGKELLAEHLKFVERLRSEGDPLGDYLWTRAHADGWVSNPITDPLLLKKMYEEAAARGSLDAQHVLGLMLITGASSPYGGGRSTTPTLPLQERNVGMGMETVERATKQQCWYWEPVIAGVSNTRCLQPSISARRIWPNVRDGQIFEKDSHLLNHWKQMDENCKAFLDKQGPAFFYRDKFLACRN